MARTKVFISYSHEDAEWMERLKKQLGVLERQGLLDVWVDTELKAGEEWHNRLHQEMLSAKVAVLLVSADFLTSDFVCGGTTNCDVGHRNRSIDRGF